VGNLTRPAETLATKRWTLTFDCADAAAMEGFWTLALGYIEAPPPMADPEGNEVCVV
jgi:hypothetical protein